MGLPQRIRSLRQLASAVERGLPKSALRSSAARIYENAAAQSELIHRVIPEATLKRRRDVLKADESERTERLARVIATALYVWDNEADARRFLTTAHGELDGRRPIDLALSELGAREVEELLWKLHYGMPV
ncbi:MAG: antitoxin Xre/MbcA/ParS toxin-binding domain-containing protein [Candidatus Binataceae bacterium]